MVTLATIAAAALAARAWWVAMTGGSYPRREARPLLGWAVLACAAQTLTLAPGPAAPVLSDLLTLGASALALVALSRMARRATGLDPLVVLCESALVVLSLTTLAWVVLQAPRTPPAADQLTLARALTALVALAVVVRIGWPGPSARPRALATRPLTAGLAAGGLLVLSEAVHALAAYDVALPGLVETAAATAGYLLASLVARYGGWESLARRPPDPIGALSYMLALGALGAVCLQALLAGTGPMPVLLGALVVVSLVLLQRLGLRDNARLVAELDDSRRRLEALVENASDLIVRLDTNGRVLDANEAAVRLLHRTPVALVGRSFDDLARLEDRRSVREAVLAVARGRRVSDQVELRLAPPATGTAHLRLRAIPGGAVANLNDATDAVELRSRLEKLVRDDPMTGLANRSHLLEVVGSWLSEPDPQVAVLYADLDGFKGVNDRFGHGAGDRVLTEVAVRLAALAGAVDARRVVVARVGGDEFVLGLEGVRQGEARRAAEEVVAALVPPFEVAGRGVQLGVSVGLAEADAEGPERGGADRAAQLVHRADLAMYAAKEGGRARVGVWHPELELRARRRVDIAIGLRRALDTGRLALAYQPIVRLSDGVVVAAEALLRLPPGLAGPDPGAVGTPQGGGYVSPAELVAVAEDTGAIIEVGEWVLSRAAQQAAAWAAAGHDLSVSVNMSVQQLVSPAFVGTVHELLDAHELPPTRLLLELTESQLAGSAGPAVGALDALRRHGVRLAIDDFGAGYSSLAYLRRMPVHVVKLDRALLEGVQREPRAAALVRSVIGMARDLDLLVVAEGLEDVASARLMRDLGAWAGQGFALGRAMPPDELVRMLARPVPGLETVIDLTGETSTGPGGGPADPGADPGAADPVADPVAPPVAGAESGTQSRGVPQRPRVSREEELSTSLRLTSRDAGAGG